MVRRNKNRADRPPLFFRLAEGALVALPAVCLLCVIASTSPAQPSGSGAVGVDEDTAESTTIAVDPAPGAATPMGPMPPDREVDRVLLIGSSSMEWGFGPSIQRELEALDPGIEFENVSRSATGLARLDYFDSLSHAREAAEEFEPDLVIGQFGGNDAQAVIRPDDSVVSRFGRERWSEEYADRVARLIRSMQELGAQTVLIGLPNMRSEQFAGRIETVNQAIARGVEQANAERNANAIYLPTWQYNTDEDGDYRELFEDSNGRRYRIQQDDGVHLSRRGSRFVAAHVVAELLEHPNFRRRFDLAAPPPEPLVEEPGDEGTSSSAASAPTESPPPSGP